MRSCPTLMTPCFIALIVVVTSSSKTVWQRWRWGSSEVGGIQNSTASGMMFGWCWVITMELVPVPELLELQSSKRSTTSPSAKNYNSEMAMVWMTWWTRNWLRSWKDGWLIICSRHPCHSSFKGFLLVSTKFLLVFLLQVNDSNGCYMLFLFLHALCRWFVHCCVHWMQDVFGSQCTKGNIYVMFSNILTCILTYVSKISTYMLYFLQFVNVCNIMYWLYCVMSDVRPRRTVPMAWSSACQMLGPTRPRVCWSGWKRPPSKTWRCWAFQAPGHGPCGHESWPVTMSWLSHVAMDLVWLDHDYMIIF